MKKAILTILCGTALLGATSCIEEDQQVGSQPPEDDVPTCFYQLEADLADSPFSDHDMRKFAAAIVVATQAETCLPADGSAPDWHDRCAVVEQYTSLSLTPVCLYDGVEFKYLVSCSCNP